MMDIFRWLKREWDTTQSCRRRDSEPIAPVSECNFNSPRSRDEAYVRALKKFNEWRHKERSASFRRSSRRSSKKSSNKQNSEKSRSLANSEMMKEAKIPEDGNNDGSHLYEELKTPRRTKPKHLLDSAKKFLQKSQSYPANIANCNNNNNVEAENKINVLKSSEKCSAISENDENEVEEFENKHCTPEAQIEEEKLRKQTSPPEKFFRDNSNPFAQVRSPIRLSKYNLATFSNPKRLFTDANASIDEFVRDSLPRSKAVPKVLNNSVAPANSKPKKYDFNPSAIYENEGKSKRISQTPMYQTVVNRHGDLVEYAIPFSDQNDEEFCELADLQNQNSKLVQTSTNLNATTLPTVWDNRSPNERRVSRSLCNLDDYAEVDKSRRNTIITDLDKSDDNSKNKFEADDIFAELDTLGKWSKRLDGQLDFQPHLMKEIKGNNLIICTASDISQRISTLKSTMRGPISLSSGNFRKTTVSLRKIEKRFRIQSEQGLMHELSVLNKIKHPNVTLLMAVCLDMNNKILSLVLEPFTTNINSMIYDSDCKISMEDCVEYILQVIKAVIYLHENAIIHSNICSHNILVCENKKMIKLSSFELATEVDVTRIQNEIIYAFYGNLENFQKSILKRSISDEGLSSLISKNKIPSGFLPFLIEYRKLYSEHYYQPPELLSTEKHFVFPSKSSDVYSISLLLWEMLNSCVPFAVFSYEETESLFRLTCSNQLPLFDSDRCELFENLLQSGLNSLPQNRIDNVQSVKFLVDEARANFRRNQFVTKSPAIGKDLSTVSNIEKNFLGEEKQESSEGSKSVCVRSSTFKQHNNSVSDQYVIKDEPIVRKCLGNQESKKIYNSRSLDDILQGDSTMEKRKQYRFHIDEFSLPSTPIARKNKLRRNAWLSNKTLYDKSFNESEEDALKNLNNKNDSSQIAAKNKLINVSIKIIQNKIGKNKEATPSDKATENTPKVSSQIEYWNSITSPGDISLKKQNNTESNLSQLSNDLCKTPEGRFEDDHPKGQSTPRAVISKSSEGSTRKVMKDRAKYYPNMPELLSETFLRRSFRDDSDFESTLWKREKERCEKLNPRCKEQEVDGVVKPLRTSVKDTVHKFESFTNKRKVFRNIPLRSHSEKQLNVSRSRLDNIVSTRSNRTFEQESRNAKSSVAVNTNINVPNVDSTTFEDKLPTAKLDIQLKNTNMETLSSKLQSPNVASSTTTIAEEKISQLTIPPLQRKTTSLSPARKSKPTLFSINVRKINRRASDIGCVRKLAKRENSIRHSICGTDLVRNVAKMSLKPKQASSDNVLTQKSSKSVASLAESDIQHCKLSCWKCGSKVFKLDEIAFNEKAIRTKKFLRRFSTSPSTQMQSSDVSQRILPTSSVEEMRSIEDIYIDDDFECGQGSLGANMRLLSPEQDDLSDILSIDFLSTDLFDSME